MAIQRKRPLVASSPDVLGNGADHPDHPEKMIGVAMGQERVMDVGRPDARPFKLGEDGVAAAGIHKQGLLAVKKDETRVVTARGPGVAGPEDNEFFHDIRRKRCDGQYEKNRMRRSPSGQPRNSLQRKKTLTSQVL